MLRICFSLFLTGVILGSGPCLATCGPILVTYIAGTKKSPMGGLWSWFVFSITRFFIYLALGAIAAFAGAELFNRFYWELPGYIIWFVSGFFIIFLGLLICLGPASHFKVCRGLNEGLIQKDTKSLIVLGALVGIFPCVPLVGVLSYITMVSTSVGHGVAMAAAFSLGTIISPLIFLGMLAASIPRLKVLQDKRSLGIFQKISGVVLIILGIHIMIRTLMAYVKG